MGNKKLGYNPDEIIEPSGIHDIGDTIYIWIDILGFQKKPKKRVCRP